MSLSDRGLRAGLLALALFAPLALASCTSFAPVYGDNGIVNSELALTYAKPTNRLEQIIYQDLALRLGKSSDANAPLVTIKTSTKSRSLPTADASPVSQKQVTVTATITIAKLETPTTADAAAVMKTIYTASRNASADYTTGPQSLANQQAAEEASERAAKALAETVRLTIIAALASPAQ